MQNGQQCMAPVSLWQIKYWRTYDIGHSPLLDWWMRSFEKKQKGIARENMKNSARFI